MLDAHAPNAHVPHPVVQVTIVEMGPLPTHDPLVRALAHEQPSRGGSVVLRVEAEADEAVSALPVRSRDLVAVRVVAMPPPDVDALLVAVAHAPLADVAEVTRH